MAWSSISLKRRRWAQKPIPDLDPKVTMPQRLFGLSWCSAWRYRFTRALRPLLKEGLDPMPGDWLSVPLPPRAEIAILAARFPSTDNRCG